MIDSQLRIVTHGRLVAGFAREAVEANLVQLCKYSPDHLSRVFSGRPFVFKSGLDRVAAHRYLQVLTKAGIVCRIEPAPQSAPATAGASRPAARTTPAQADTALTCPFCRTVQASTDVCVQCHSLIDPRPIAGGDYAWNPAAAKSGSAALRWVLVILAFLLSIALLAYGSTRLQLYAQNVQQNMERLGAAGSGRFTKVAPPEQPPVSGAMPYTQLTRAENAQIRQLLFARDFTALNTLLETIQQEFEQDPVHDSRICQAFDLFSDDDPGRREVFDAWVAATPDHYASYLARGIFLTSMGWTARGHSWARDTSQDQFREMREYFDLASVDLSRSLQINPRLLPAYLRMISIAMAHGTDQEEEELSKQARSLFPSSYQLYRKLIGANLPRWGGSYAEMTRLAIEANRHVDENPEMPFLYGKPYIDQAWYAVRDKEYAKAIELYNQALAYGEYAELFDLRGKAYEKSDAPLQAIADYRRAIEINPNYTEASYHLASQLYRQAKYPQALDVVQAAQKQAAPRNRDLLAWYKWTLGILPRKDRSAADTYRSAANDYVAAKKISSFPLPHKLAEAKTEHRFRAPKGAKPLGLTWLNGQLYLSLYMGTAAGVYRYNPDGIVQELFKPEDVFADQYGGLTTDGERLFHLPGTNGSNLQLLDAKTHKPIRQQYLYASQFIFSDLALHDGYLYTIGCHQPQFTNDYRLLKFSLDGTLRDSFDLSDFNGMKLDSGLASDGRHLWIALANTLLKFDPETGSIKDVLKLRDKLYGLAWDGQQLWGVTSEGEVITIAVN